jgi:hypothetical protein
MAVSVKLSPVLMETDELNCMDMLNVPDVLAVQNEMSVTVSGDVPAHDVHSGMVPLALTTPADGEPHVTASRVVTEDTSVVPDAPGGPV